MAATKQQKNDTRHALYDVLISKGKEFNLSPKDGAEIVAEFTLDYLLTSCEYTGVSKKEILNEFIRQIEELRDREG